MHEGKYMSAKKDVNVQGQIFAKVGAMAIQRTTKEKLQSGNYIDNNR